MRMKQLGLSTLGIVLVIVLLVILFGSAPVWPHAVSWGYGPSGLVGLILIIVIVLLVMGKL